MVAINSNFNNNYKIMNLKIKVLSTFFSLFLAITSLIGQIDFGAYYTKFKTGQDWEAYSRTGIHSDIIVQISGAGGQLVFWRGNSYCLTGRPIRANGTLQKLSPVPVMVQCLCLTGQMCIRM